MSKARQLADLLSTGGKIGAESADATILKDADINVSIGGISGATGSTITPTGTTAQRDGSPSAGYFRFNSTLTAFEGYDGSAWGEIGGGKGLGNGQTWQDVTASRAANTTYTNSTGRAIAVFLRAAYGGGGTLAFHVDGVLISDSYEGGSNSKTQTFIIPKGSTYKFIPAGAAYIILWSELR